MYHKSDVSQLNKPLALETLFIRKDKKNQKIPSIINFCEYLVLNDINDNDIIVIGDTKDSFIVVIVDQLHPHIKGAFGCWYKGNGRFKNVF